MANEIEKYIKSILPEPKKRDFYDLLHRAIDKGEKATTQKQKQQKSGGYTGKQTRQCKGASV